MLTSSASLRDRRFLLILLAGGLVLRLIWLTMITGGVDQFAGSGEATRVAIALAQGKGLADVYFAGSGPTAHLLPLSPLAAALPMWLFGVDTPAANLGLVTWALAQVGFAYWMLLRLFTRLGADPLALRWGFALLCLVPIFVQRETIDFRYWEGASALGLVAASLAMIAAISPDEGVSSGTMIKGSLLAALTFFVSPPVGMAAIACWALFALHRLPIRRSLGFAAIMAAALALFLGPWAIRNHEALGSAVLVRSNAGLEIALANHDGALSNRPVDVVLTERLHALHPYHGEAARDALIASGSEVAYSKRLGAITSGWIRAHPMGFARLSLDRLQQLYFPQAWAYRLNESDRFNPLRSALLVLVNALGLAFLAVGLVGRRRGYWLLAVYLGCVSATYMIVQPIPRYTYLVYTPLLFVVADGLVRLARTAIAFGQRASREAARGAGWAR